jgi:hypothetical protein
MTGLISDVDVNFSLTAFRPALEPNQSHMQQVLGILCPD